MLGQRKLGVGHRGSRNSPERGDKGPGHRDGDQRVVLTVEDEERWGLGVHPIGGRGGAKYFRVFGCTRLHDTLLQEVQQP